LALLLVMLNLYPKCGKSSPIFRAGCAVADLEILRGGVSLTKMPAKPELNTKKGYH